jgi:L-2,4-diaminobutyric acid acetyltransferase
MSNDSAVLQFRRPELKDGQTVWRLVKEAGTLDLNSTYLYLLLCDHFADTCVLAELNGEPIGFVTAYRPPESTDTLFVWQVGVAARARGRGVAKGLLLELLRRKSCLDINWIETTVSPSNSASRALFDSLAQELGATLYELPYMDESLFPAEGDHEAEPLLRIGPLHGLSPAAR